MGSVDLSPDAQDPREPVSIEEIAAAWLAAESDLVVAAGDPERAEAAARDLSGRYDEAIRSATREELRLAWEAARRTQGEQEMGSESWATARRVSELLADEYLAADPEPAASADVGSD